MNFFLDSPGNNFCHNRFYLKDILCSFLPTHSYESPLHGEGEKYLLKFLGHFQKNCCMWLEVCFICEVMYCCFYSAIICFSYFSKPIAKIKVPDSTSNLWPWQSHLTSLSPVSSFEQHRSNDFFFFFFDQMMSKALVPFHVVIYKISLFRNTELKMVCGCQFSTAEGTLPLVCWALRCQKLSAVISLMVGRSQENSAN